MGVQVIKINVNKTELNIFSEFKMTGSQNRILNSIKEGKDILEDLETDGNCKMPEQDLTNLIHEVRGRRMRKSILQITKLLIM
jgi:hypothetical protein